MKKIVACFVVLAFCLMACRNKEEVETTTSDDAIAITLKNTTIESTSSNVKIDGSIATIVAAGTYEVSGTLEDGQIRVEVSDKEHVTVILNNANIHNDTSAAIYVVNADKTTITVADGSDNTLSDGSEYTFRGADTEPNATVFSHDDLLINGTGTLRIEANYEDAIASKDDLEIESATLHITAADDGIRGKDSVQIRSGNIEVNAVSDAIKATNDTDATKGYVTIDGGTFKLTTTGNGDASSKGIKAYTTLTIHDGTFEIVASDDAIHAADVHIVGGDYTIHSGDDGIHGDTTLVIDGGTIAIAESYEGIEAADLTINDGTISIVASDDGINAAGGTDTTTTNEQGYNDMFSTSTGTLTINGGMIEVNAEGDGVDVNGNAVMNGGTLIVHGPTLGGNGALDYDGTFVMNGGTMVAVGTSNMAMAPSTSSSQLSIMVNLTATQAAGTNVRLVSSNGDEIISQTMVKSFQSIVISDRAIQNNTSYDLYLNDTKYATITTTGTVTTSGNTGGMQGGPGGMR